MAEKKLLYEISIIRPLVIFLLVVYHCLCLYTGGWKAPEGLQHIPAYYWLGKLISGFRIECIAFVGGYVMAYQFIDRGKDQRFLPFVWKKIKRLIFPGILFGFIFWMIFRYNGHWNTRVMILRLLGGVEHLWFLPMLFWCFMVMWLVAKFLKPHQNKWLGWILLVILAAVSILPNPHLHYGLTQVNHFLFYFYGGYFLWALSNSEPLLSKKQNWGNGRLHLAIILLVLYVTLLLLRLQIGLPNRWNGMLMSGLKWGHICCGILSLYFFVMHYLSQQPEGYTPKPWVIWSSGVCYGVYVFHGFFLKWLYFNSQLPLAVPSWILPWLALVITLVGSLLISVGMKKCGIKIL